MTAVLLDVASSVRDVRAASVTVDGKLDDVWNAVRCALAAAEPFWLTADGLAVGHGVQVAGAWFQVQPIDGPLEIRANDAHDEQSSCSFGWEDGTGSLTGVLTVHPRHAGSATATIEYATSTATGDGARVLVELLDLLGESSAMADQFRAELSSS